MMVMGFKVGDKVTINKGLNAGAHYDRVYCNSDMAKMGGKTFTITNLLDGGKFELEGQCWSWNDTMVSPVTNYKYKVGEKVRVKENLRSDVSYGMYDSYETDTFVGQMRQFAGKIVTIDEMASGKYRMAECEGWNFTDEMLEPVQEVVPEPTPTPIPKAEKTKIDFIATPVSHFIVVGDVTICIPIDSPVGIAVKHPDDIPNAEIGMGLSQFRMFNDAEANDLL
jgi:hypothetical protein